MPTSPERRGGKRTGRRRVFKANRRVQNPVWKTLAVNASVTAPAYGTVTLRLPHVPSGLTTTVALVAGSALATWMNIRSGNRRK